ncbi:hypothetical protein ACU4GD_41180 [Cupriavidus basilensis]
MLLSTLGTAPCALAADAVLVLDTSPRETRDAPALDLAVTRFAGNASGTYYWEDGLPGRAGSCPDCSRAPTGPNGNSPTGQRLLSSRRQLSHGAGTRGRAGGRARRRAGCGACTPASAARTAARTASTACCRSSCGPGFDRAKATTAGDVGARARARRPARPTAARRSPRWRPPRWMPATRRPGRSGSPRDSRRKCAVPAGNRPSHRAGCLEQRQGQARAQARRTTDSIEQVLAFYKQPTPRCRMLCPTWMAIPASWQASARGGGVYTVNLKQDKHFPDHAPTWEVEISE